MELIIDFYKELDTLNLIIFWGIIIVIVLLLIFSFILINKNKKLKSLINKENKKKEALEKQEKIEIEISKKEPSNNFDDEIPQIFPVQETKNEEKEAEQENTQKTIETENDFVAEEHVIGYKTNINLQPKIEKNDISQIKQEEKTIKKEIEMPTGPYQRNVLREMSLSQTSPIGINRQENRKVEMIKDLEESLNTDEFEDNSLTEEHKNKQINNQISKELNNIKESIPSKRLTEISPRNTRKEELTKETNIEKKEPQQVRINLEENKSSEILKNYKSLEEQPKIKSSSEKYLEEVSKKLAEAEIPDEIERTNYELKQEEDAIISYTELMAKKDSIETIDEEDAVISIEELINRNNQKNEEPQEKNKLYNLSEEEENDNFIKELKQFRNDL